MKCKKCGTEFEEGIFCPECGTKNVLDEVASELVWNDGEEEEEITDIDKALENVLFYYEQSSQKKEAEQNDHLYYDRAQQLLKRMIKQKISDYRVWWEACKPVDFWEKTFSEEMIMKYKVNDAYFTRALDCADIEEKKKIIEERDSYQERKRNILDEINRVKAEKKAEEDRRKEEEQKRAEEEQQKRNAEEQREADRIRKAEEEQRKRDAEAKRERERIKQEQKEQRKYENEGKAMAVASLIFGIISLCTFGCWFIPEILGIIFAFMGKKQGVMRGQAKAGLICSCISIIIVIGILIWGMSLSS